MKTVSDLIVELQSLKPYLKKLPVKVIAPNGLLVEPKIKRIVANNDIIVCFEVTEEIVISHDD